MNHQGLHCNVHCIENVGLGKWLNLYKCGFKIYDLLVLHYWALIINRNIRPIMVKDCTPVSLNISLLCLNITQASLNNPLVGLFTVSYQTFFGTEQTKFWLVPFLCSFIYNKQRKCWDGNPKAQNPESRIWCSETRKLAKFIKLEFMKLEFMKLAIIHEIGIHEIIIREIGIHEIGIHNIQVQEIGIHEWQQK